MKATLKQVIEIIEQIYPPCIAEQWDSVGLISGDENQKVNKILIAIDPVMDVVQEAIHKKADLLFVHHPLFLFGTKAFASNDPKGRIVRELILNNCALYNAHTNADKANYGVSHALANLIPMKNVQVLEENKVLDSDNNFIGLGRIGEIEPITLKEFAKKLARVLPADHVGLQVSGKLDDIIKTVAYSPGAGQSMLEQARKKCADVYVCADLKHHVASEFTMGGKPYLVMPTHWASEWPWVKMCASILKKVFKEKGLEISVEYSSTITDPWNMHVDNKNVV